jgi:signal peptidase II
MPESEPAPVDRPSLRSHALYWLVLALAVFVVLADQSSKWWAETALGDGERIPVLGELLSFWLVYNPGAAFSIGEEFTLVLAIVAGVAVVGIAWYSWRVRSRAWAVALGLVLGGATTHLGDRLFRQPGFGRGHVVDFIDYAGFFVGNVADIALVGGAVMIVVLSLVGLRAGDKQDDEPVVPAAHA